MSALEGKAQRSGAGVGDQHFAGVGPAMYWGWTSSSTAPNLESRVEKWIGTAEFE